MKKALFTFAILGVFATMGFAATPETPDVTTNSVVAPDKAATDQPVKKHKKEERKHKKPAKKPKKAHKATEKKAGETATTTVAPEAPAPTK